MDNEQNISLLCNGVLIRNLLQLPLPKKRVGEPLVKFCQLSLSILENKTEQHVILDTVYNAVSLLKQMHIREISH